MEQKSIDDLARLGALEALGQRASDLAARRLAMVLKLALVFDVILLLASTDGSRVAFTLACAALVLVLVLLLGTLQGAASGSLGAFRRAVARQPRGFAMAFLVVHYAILLAHSYAIRGEPVLCFVYGAFVLFFRLALPELLTVHGGIVGLTLLVGLTLGSPSGPGDTAPMLVGSGFMNALFLGGGLLASRRFRRRFAADWSTARERWQEEQRLRQELDYARQMQLAMLPQRGPAVDWLDAASLSLPATEVGGDYYDYFPLPDGRVAVVVADVAGHGMESGLVLSGVRGCLLLLAEEMNDPALVLSRLHDMLRRDQASRRLVALALAVIDPGKGELTLASAAAPPLLVWRSTGGGAEAIESSSMPLGAGLVDGFASQRIAVAPGDFLLLYSDGLYETSDADDEPFGLDRLRASFQAAAAAGTAHQVRDAILSELWTFKGDAAQQDDITMVVLQLVGRSA